MEGYVTKGLSGDVIYSSTAVNCGGIWLYDQARPDYVALVGDSGGPVYTTGTSTVLISPTESSTRGLVHTHSGSITLDGKQSIQVVGDTISKSGRTTHDTSGQITHTCVTTGSSTYGTLNCQHYASYNSDGGDSGGAVYGFDIPTGDYKWYGVHWAKFDQGPLTGTTVYSPVSGIEIDQGTLTIN